MSGAPVKSPHLETESLRPSIHPWLFATMMLEGEATVAEGMFFYYHCQPPLARRLQLATAKWEGR